MIRSLLALPLLVLGGSVTLAQPHPFPPQHVHLVPIPVYTMDNFAREFRAGEGHHRILIIHPVTCRPVEVCFTLPCGKLRELDVNRRSIEFDFGRNDVHIHFRSNGTVDVHAD